MGSSVQISLSPALLSIAKLSDGAVASRHSISLSPAEWDDAMVKGFRPFDSALSQATRLLNIPRGARVEVSYAGKDAVVDLLSYPSSGSAARDAAVYALEDRLPGGIDGEPSATWIVGQDTGSKSRTHVLACVDRNQNVEAIASWIRRAGLRPQRIVPAAALPLAECTRRVLEHSGDDSVAAVYFGGAFTCIAAGRGGSVQFVRVMNFGVDLLTDAYMRDQASAARDGVPAPDARSLCRDAVWRQGVPSRSETHAGGASVLPLLVPIIQKFLVEIKQTIRFGFGEAELGRVIVLALGPGSTIPGFTGVLSDGLELPIEGDSQQVTSGSFALDHAELAVRHPHHDIDVSPASEIHARTSRRLTMSVAAGTLLGLFAVGVDAGLTFRDYVRAREQVEVSSPIVQQSREHFLNREKAAVLSAAFRDEHNALADAMSVSADWPAVLLELGRLTDANIRLTQIDAENNNGKPRIEISGLAFTDSASDELRNFMTKLMQSPLAQSVELGPTRRTEAEGRDATHFTLTALLRPLPPVLGAPATVAAAGKEGTP